MRTIEEVQTTGLKALNQALGLVDMVRFIQMNSLTSGDYTADKYNQRDDLLEDLTKQYPEAVSEFLEENRL